MKMNYYISRCSLPAAMVSGKGTIAGWEGARGTARRPSPRSRGEGAAKRRMRGATRPIPAEWRPSPGAARHPLPASGARDLKGYNPAALTEPEVSESELVRVRREKLARIAALGYDPFPT